MGDFVDEKMARDPAYAPYCMRCPGIRRMDRLSPSIAQCPACGACHDTRRAPPAPTYTPEPDGPAIPTAQTQQTASTPTGEKGDHEVQVAT